MKQWFKQEIDSERKAINFQNHLKGYGIKAFVANRGEGYITYMFGEPNDLKSALLSFDLASKEETESDPKNFLKILFEQVELDSLDEDRTVKIFYAYLLHIVEKGTIVKLLTKNQIVFIRKVGGLMLDENNKYYIQTYGDLKGMIVWNKTFVEDIIKVCN